jgi:hypothetical protein
MRIANFKVDYSQPIKLLDGGKVSAGGLYERQDYDTESKGLKILNTKDRLLLLILNSRLN